MTRLDSTGHDRYYLTGHDRTGQEKIRDGTGRGDIAWYVMIRVAVPLYLYAPHAAYVILRLTPMPMRVSITLSRHQWKY